MIANTQIPELKNQNYITNENKNIPKKKVDWVSIRRKSKTTTDMGSIKEDDSLIKEFLYYVFTDLSKRTLKPIDMFSINELTDLPLIICEKLCKLCSPVSNTMNQEDFIYYMTRLYFSGDRHRLILFADLLDFKQKDLIYKNDLKIILIHLHMHLMHFQYKKELIKIINKFYGDKECLTKEEFLKISFKTNFDVAYILFTFFDKYSFVDKNTIELFYEEKLKMTNGILLGKYNNKKNYNTTLVSEIALGYAKKIKNSMLNERDPFNDDIDEELDELEMFENELSQLMFNNFTNDLSCNKQKTNYKFKNKNEHYHSNNESNLNNNINISNQANSNVNINVFKPVSSVNNNNHPIFKNNVVEMANISTSDSLFEIKKLKVNCKVNALGTNINNNNVNANNSCESELNENNSNNMGNNINYYKDKTERTEKESKIYDLFNNKKLFQFGLIPSNNNIYNSHFFHSLSIRTYSKSPTSNNVNNLGTPKSKYFYLNPNYNILDCYKQSKKGKILKRVKLIHVNSFIFYYSSNSIINEPTLGESENKNQQTLSHSPGHHHNKSKNKKQFLSLKTEITRTNISNPSSQTTKKDKDKSLRNIFYLKKIFLAKRLYPTIIKYNTNDYYQLQLDSNLHNNQQVLMFYSKNEHNLTEFAKRLSEIQHQKGVNFSDNYDIQSKIGKGKFGSVSTAIHKLSKRTVAVKIISKIDISTEENFKTFKWENDVFKFLQNASSACKNIVRCYEYYETPNNIYYVTEYLMDGDLKTYLDSFTNNGLKLSEKTINEICIQMLNGISFLHKYGIIHRDIKFTNTLIKKSKKIIYKIDADKKGQKIFCHDIEEIKIIDFGLCKVMGLDDTTHEPYGSLSFKAPELILENNYSFAVDIWSFGITIYYIMFNEFPVNAKNINNLKDKIISENYLDTITQKGSFGDLGWRVIFETLTKDPKKRPKASVLLKNITKNYH